MGAREWSVILGASAGTGAEIARAVARDPGLDVFGVHRGNHSESADQVEQDIRAVGGRVKLLTDDAGTPEGAARGADSLLEVAGTGKVQLFVHSLASASLGRFASGGKDQLVPRQIHKTFDVMANSFVFWTQELLARDLLAPGARLLGLTNPLDESLILDCGLIAATKAALESYIRALALELGPQGYRVNLLKFSTVITPAMRKVYSHEALEHTVNAHRTLLPAGRMCTVEQVGRVVSFLAGPDAEYFNGATIDFSGGMSLGLAEVLLGRRGSD